MKRRHSSVSTKGDTDLAKPAEDLASPADMATAPADLACNGSTDYASDVNNCGHCGNVCDAGKGCVAGACVVIPDFAVCSDHFQSDPNNCGHCGNVCDAGKSCVAGACV